MSIHAALRHATRYRYDRLVTLGPQTVRLRPAPHARTPVLAYSLTVEPKPHFLNWQQDPQGNFLARIVFPDRVDRFEVIVDLVADMATQNPFDFFLEPEAEAWPFRYDPLLANELAPFRKVEPPTPRLAAFLQSIAPGPDARTVDFLVGLNARLASEIGYIVRMEPGVWSPEETLAAGRGSCRDSGWLLVQVLRYLGFAARFCSGYLIQLVADVTPLHGPEGPTRDFTDLHAWCEVYLPGAGWIGLDPTSGLLTGEGHIPLAATPDPQSAAPISGLVGEAKAEFGFEMHVARIVETPRTTKPYTPELWEAIEAEGARIDGVLQGNDVRLTFGGEPTFVAADDPDAPEWNTDALGPTKRAIAGRLMRRLAGLWAPGAALHYGMGKQYPGEQLPRWALTAHWRRDGEPVWNDPALLADDDWTDDSDASVAAGFVTRLAERLQVDPGCRVPAHEDVHYYLWREKRLPANVVVEDAKLRDPLERERLARVFGQGLATEAGSVLPLRRVSEPGLGRRWQTGKWVFRGGTMFLIPGDSPIGLRLPLDSLPWIDPDDLPVWAEADPFTPRDPFPRRGALGGPNGADAARLTDDELARLKRGLPVGFHPDSGVRVAPKPFAPVSQPLPDAGPDSADTIRTALAVEAREGRLHVFLPPLTDAADWIDLVAAIEATAEETGRKVVLEGYLPPADPRLNHFSVTPDPGVIEVNVHPAQHWHEIATRTRELYREAREVGLATEKFMLDGRHVGTGGGNHVVMGGLSPGDSPFLRRPDLLRSVVAFWHNHPSLSYLFSGLFIGPTSQHPRVDEARNDSLYELEIAMRQIAPGRDTAPWMTDRLFRNLLVDITGNTHRTEFCIDKMYAPESASGRRGLVEFRGFEMPPHWQMSLAQQVLMRAAIAAFWQRPYERGLVRWGTRLHDEFMLPHFIRADLEDALDELRAQGFAVDPEWFEPHLAFRFPKTGGISVRGMAVELRHALEPWHVMGEEPAGGGTVRYVDSSVERLQAKVEGWVEERFLLACNGRAVPLAPTGRTGEYVAGVRFKAWSPPSSLHPTIGSQAPLVFDVHDTWTGRSLGGCTHHVAHQGGLAYERFPVNANEAEARRRARFIPFGHSPGARTAPPLVVDREHPRTLDLRRHV